MLASLALNGLFVQLAGTWGRPPIERTGLLEQMAANVRVIEAAPVPLRSSLASAASHPMLEVVWHERRADFHLPPGGMQVGHEHSPLQQLLGDVPRDIRVFNPGDWPDESPQAHYVALVELRDGSWLSFTPPERSWGSTQAYGLRSSSPWGWWLPCWSPGLPRDNWPVRCNALPALHGALAMTCARRRSRSKAPTKYARPPLPSTPCRRRSGTFSASVRRCSRPSLHDLRALLTRMRLRSEFMDDLEQQRKMVRDIEEMQTMINAALGFFRDESHGSTPRHSTFRIAANDRR